MGRVDPADDAIERFVVRHYRFDPERHQRRHVVVEAFDNEHELKRSIHALRRALERLRAVEPVDPKEHVSGVVWEPHHRELAANGRLLRRAADRGSIPRDLLSLPLPPDVSLFGEPPASTSRVPSQRKPAESQITAPIKALWQRLTR
jgi:hypothetical protein